VKKSKSTVKEIYTIDILPKGKEIHIEIKANDFLHNMARMLVSTLLDIGLEKREVPEITAILGPSQEIIGSLPASAQGLFLKEVEY
jgi:tRNA pseudouridine38-40 synthase